MARITASCRSRGRERAGSGCSPSVHVAAPGKAWVRARWKRNCPPGHRPELRLSRGNHRPTGPSTTVIGIGARLGRPPRRGPTSARVKADGQLPDRGTRGRPAGAPSHEVGRSPLLHRYGAAPSFDSRSVRQAGQQAWPLLPAPLLQLKYTLMTDFPRGVAFRQHANRGGYLAQQIAVTDVRRSCSVVPDLHHVVPGTEESTAVDDRRPLWVQEALELRVQAHGAEKPKRFTLQRGLARQSAPAWKELYRATRPKVEPGPTSCLGATGAAERAAGVSRRWRARPAAERGQAGYSAACSNANRPITPR
jgi:hypothetical protein